MTVMALMQNEIFLKSTPTCNVGTQKLKCTQARVQSSELLHYHQFGRRSCDPAAFAAPACNSAAVLAAASGLFSALGRLGSHFSTKMLQLRLQLAASSGGSMTAPFDLAHNHVPVGVLDACCRHRPHAMTCTDIFIQSKMLLVEMAPCLGQGFLVGVAVLFS